MTAERVPQPTPGTETPPWPPVSVIMCVRNERRHLAAAVASVLAQDYPAPLEVVVAVGPSRDSTLALARELAAHDDRIRVLENPSGRTPSGLNIAVGAVRHPIVARLDGHCVMPPGYLRRAVATLRRTGAANVGGVMAAVGETPFEQAVARAMTSWLGVGGARFHTGGGEGPVDTVYLGVFVRDVLWGLGGYDEQFSRAQDYELNVRIRAAGGIVWFDPELEVTYRPRPTLRALSEQYLNYGRWRWIVTRQHPRSVRGRYLAAPAALVAIVAGTGAAAGGWLPGLVVPAGYLAGVTAGSLLISRSQPLGVRSRLPLVLVTMHMSWAAGFLSYALTGRKASREARTAAFPAPAGASVAEPG